MNPSPRHDASLDTTGIGTGRRDRTTDSEALLDRGVEMTFPASDPVSVEHAFREADDADPPDRTPEPGDAPRDPPPSRRCDDAQDDRRRSLRDLRIGFDGRQYRFGGYRYDRCEDAVAYARLVASRPRGPARGGDAAEYLAHEPPFAPSADEQRVMASTGVTFAAGRFVVDRCRYDRLADAVAYVMRGRSAHDERETLPPTR